MPPLDVAVVTHNVVRQDGQGRVMVEVVRALLQRGHDLTVYSRAVAPELAGDVRFHRLPRPPGPGLTDDLVLLAAATGSLRRAHHDVTCVMGPCALPRPPFVYYAQFSQAGWRQSWTGGHRPSRYHLVHSGVGSRLERYVSARATKVVTCSSRVGAELGVDLDRLTVVPNGVVLEEFPAVTPARRVEARKRLGLSPDAFVVVFVGEYRTPRKGVGPLIEAVGLGLEGEHLLVAGRGDESWARAVARRSGVS